MKKPVTTYQLTLKGFFSLYVDDEMADKLSDKLSIIGLRGCNKDEYPAIILEDDCWVFKQVKKENK